MGRNSLRKFDPNPTVAVLRAAFRFLIFKSWSLCICRVLDQRVSLRQVTVRQRSSVYWYDDECRQSKRRLRRLERDACRDGRLLADISGASVLWRDARRQYVKLLHQKKSAYWTGHIEDNRSNPRRLWQTFDNLLGRHSIQTSEIGRASCRERVSQ